MKKNFILNAYTYLMFTIIFYILIPYFIFSNETSFFEFSGVNFERYYGFNFGQNSYYIIHIFILFFVFFIFTSQNNESSKKIDYNYNIVKYLAGALIIFLIFEIGNLLFYNINFFLNDENLLNSYRSNVYTDFLGKRQTHIKMIIILSVFLFKENKKIALLGYALIFFYDFISLSRYNIFSLCVLHFLIYFKISFFNQNKKKIILFFIIFFIFLNMRSAALFTTLEDVGLFHRFIARHLLGEFNSVFISLSIFNSALNEIIIILIKYPNIYIQDNFSYLMKDFFYFDFGNTIDYWNSISPAIPINYYSRFGTTYILVYFPIFILMNIILFSIVKFLKLYSLNNNLFIKTIYCYILATSFRSNIVHEIGFVIKLLILTVVLNAIFKYLSNKRFL